MHDENSARGWLRSFGEFLAQVFRDAVRTLCGLGWRRWLVILLAVAALAVAARYVDVPELSDLRAGAQQYGDFFVVLFALSYIVFTLFPLPRTIWTVAAGILFGPVLGLELALVCLTVSAALAFLGVRTLFGEWMRPRLSHPAVAGLNARLARRGWLAICSLRMVAGVPFSLLNYTAALTSIPFWQFVTATFVGSVPTTVIGVFFGEALTSGISAWILAAFLIAAAAGLLGLYVESRLPQPTASQAQDVD